MLFRSDFPLPGRPVLRVEECVSIFGQKHAELRTSLASSHNHRNSIVLGPNAGFKIPFQKSSLAGKKFEPTKEGKNNVSETETQRPKKNRLVRRDEPGDLFRFSKGYEQDSVRPIYTDTGMAFDCLARQAGRPVGKRGQTIYRVD